MIKVKISGTEELEARLKRASAELVNEVGAEVRASANEYTLLAKQSASAQFGDKGFLVSGIQPVSISPLNWKVDSHSRYSAYMEWGTITHVSVPADLADYAIQFKGKGLRTTGGIIPRPFFFKHAPLVQGKLFERIKAVLEGI